MTRKYSNIHAKILMHFPVAPSRVMSRHSSIFPLALMVQEFFSLSLLSPSVHSRTSYLLTASIKWSHSQTSKKVHPHANSKNSRKAAAPFRKSCPPRDRVPQHTHLPLQCNLPFAISPSLRENHSVPPRISLPSRISPWRRAEPG